MENDLQHITLLLDTHRVSLNVPRDKEPVFRRAAQAVNKSYGAYQKSMPKAKEDFLWAYVALQMACNLYNDAREKNLQPIDQQIRQLNELVQQSLQKNN